MNWSDFFQAIKAGDVPNLLLFAGPEEYLKREAIGALRASLLPPGLEELNEQVLEGAVQGFQLGLAGGEARVGLAGGLSEHVVIAGECGEGRELCGAAAARSAPFPYNSSIISKSNLLKDLSSLDNLLS